MCSDQSRACYNPWYVLSTIWGEHNDVIDDRTHDRNRSTWNGLVGAAYTPEKRKKFATEYKINLSEIEPLSPAERDSVERRLKTRLGSGAMLPDLLKTPNFRNLHFWRPYSVEGFVFPAGADFSGSKFDFCFRGSAFFVGWLGFHNCDFQEVLFRKPASLYGRTEFTESKFYKAAKFIELEAKEAADLVFASCNFFDKFDLSLILAPKSSIYLDGSVFHDHVTIESNRIGVNFSMSEVTFKRFFPQLSGNKIIGGLELPYDAHKFPSFSKEDAEYVSNFYFKCADMMRKRSRHRESVFFRNQALDSRKYFGGGLSRLFFTGYGLLSRYGSSVKRPLLYLLVVIVLPVPIYFMHFAPACISIMRDFSNICAPIFFDAVLNSFLISLLSLAFVRELLGLTPHLELPPPVSYVSVIQSLVSVVLLMLLVDALNRLRL